MVKSFRQRKNTGTLAENELIHMFWETEGWVCVRVAGSGSNKYPSPDLLASRGDKKIVMEVKVTAEVKKYFTGQEIRDLNFFADKFGAEAWVGVKFQKKEWFFIPTSELEITKSENYSFNLIDAKRKGFKFQEIV